MVEEVRTRVSAGVCIREKCLQWSQDHPPWTNYLAASLRLAPPPLSLCLCLFLSLSLSSLSLSLSEQHHPLRQVWEELVNARAVPLTRLRTLTTMIAARLEDKSSIVRKNAITLLTQLIKKNPSSDKV